MTSCKKKYSCGGSASWCLLISCFLAAARLIFIIIWFHQQTRTPKHHQNNSKSSLLHAQTYFLYACIWFSKRFLLYVSSPCVSCMWRAQLCQPPPFWVSPYTSPTDLNGPTKGHAYTSVCSHLHVFHCVCVFSGEPETHTLVIWFAFHGRKRSASRSLWCACRIEVCAWRSRDPKWSGNFI